MPCRRGSQAASAAGLQPWGDWSDVAPWHTQGAARMLLRVTSDIQLFSKHKVAILTSAVIECQRGGVPRQAHRLAALLMRPEHQAQVQPQYRRKVAAMLERPPPNRSE